VTRPPSAASRHRNPAGARSGLAGVDRSAAIDGGNPSNLPRKKRPMNKTLLTTLVTACALFAGTAFAANADCEAKAAEKKRAGAAKTSFIKKCEKDAGAAAAISPACEKSAADKKLAGAAKASHLKKCMADEAAAAKK
jgi:hypothetical protein